MNVDVSGRNRSFESGKVATTYLDVNELACHLRVSYQTVRRMCATGRLPPPVRVGKLLRWDRQALSEFFEGQARSEGEVSR